MSRARLKAAGRRPILPRHPVVPFPIDPKSFGALRSTPRGGDPIHRVPIAALTLEADGLVRSANTRAARLLGRPLEALIHSSFWDLLGPDEAARLREAIDAGHEGVEFAVLREGGDPIPVLLAGRVMEEGRATLWLTAAVRTLDARDSEEKLSEARAALAERALDLEAQVMARLQAIQMVLDSTGDALLSCTLDGRMVAGSSATARAWFGDPEEGAPAGPYLFHEPSAQAVFAMGLEQLLDDFLPFETVVDQMPPYLHRGERTFRITYRPIFEGGRVHRLLLVVREATAELAAQRAERNARELSAVASHILKDRAAFFGFLEECHLLVLLMEDESDVNETRRTLHTLKGNAAVHGLEGLAEAASHAEDMLAVTPERRGDAVALTSAALHEATERLSAVFGGSAPQPTVHVEEHEYEAFVDALVREKVPRALIETARSFRSMPTRILLERLARQVERVALRAEKDVIVTIEDAGTRMTRTDLGPFFTTLVHVVRNAVDHGIEPASVRTARGKPAAGHLTLRMAVFEDHFALTIEDDGGGIAWERVREKAARLGLPHASLDDLKAALFHDGFTTRNVVTDLSGRGVGLGAVRAAVLDAGGSLSLSSTEGQGTTFRFTFEKERGLATRGDPVR